MRFIPLALLAVLAAVSRCEEPHPPPPRADPKPGDFVRVRGTLAEDVDCRTLRTESGAVYSLNVRLVNLLNGSKLCVSGTLSESSQCLTQPTLEVQSVRPWSACP